MSCSMNDNQAFNEMMVHVPLCTHKEPENILVIGETSPELKKELEKHPFNIEFGDEALLNSKDEKNIDVIILTNIKISELILANINRVLKDDGLITFKTESFQNDENRLKEDLQLVGTKFWIAMPFKFGHTTAILASKKYHPTADIILQRSDILDDLDYYSTEIHHASFVFPAAIHKALTTIAKR
ncbi:spermidine synthase [Malaciobacter marinus]|uniref:spermine/spermidine synthase domain-containing protein n=1 Tax=Malaciobacter marinus TaxID=505249 RepID=UPI0009D09380|nr:spermidine synthase [Malaciobacter marinus]SKB80362.1 spermidine synthase [Malaciobacter marinus]